MIHIIGLLVVILSLLGWCVEATEQRIWFTATGDEKTLRPAARCAVLTACVFNPSHEVVIMSFVALDVSDLKPYCSNRLTVKVTTAAEALQGTPLLAWYEEAAKARGKYFKADLSDALRTAIMYLHGGVYFDLDMISLTSVSALPANALGQQLEGLDKRGRVPFINGAGMIFDARHPFMERVMNDFHKSWDVKTFGTVGPDLLWDTYEAMRAEVNATSATSSISGSRIDTLPTLLGKAVFYPIKFKSSALRNFFARPAGRLPWYPSDTVAVHLWSHLISRMDVLPTSKGGALIANCTDTAFIRKTRAGA